MNKKIILLLGIFLIVLAVNSKYNTNKPIPNIPPITVPNTPSVTKTIFYDEYELALNTAVKSNKKLVLIFGADWCPYCKDLKKDVSKIQEFEYYIVCFIDTDKNKQLIEEYKIRGLPTSIILDNKEEEARKSGYRYRDYCEWLKNNKNHGEKTWSNLLL